MVYVLHGSPFSTRVIVSAYEAGLGDKLKVDAVSDFGVIKSEEWLKHQPFGQMPYLVDEETGLELMESRAIAKYLAVKAGSPLVPATSDAAAYALFEQACSIEVSNFDKHAAAIAFQLVFGPSKGMPTDSAAVEKDKAMLAQRLKGYEAILAKHKYLAGDKLTLADLFHLPYGKMAEELGGAPGLVDGSLPNVARWWAELKALPSWNKVIAK